MIAGIFSCNKDDDGEVPVIKLIGKRDAFCWMPGPYVDAGCVATDVEDGDITANVVVVSTIDYTQVICWDMYYKVTDSDGNEATSPQRIVKLVEMDGNYSASGTCPGYMDSLSFQGHSTVTFSDFCNENA